MPRRLKAGYPKPVVKTAQGLTPTDKIPIQEVDWPLDQEETGERNFNYTHVIHDRLHPRKFSTLGHRILIEIPVTAWLVGDEYGLRQANRWIKMFMDFVSHTNHRFNEIDRRLQELEGTPRDELGRDSQSA